MRLQPTGKPSCFVPMLDKISQRVISRCDQCDDPPCELHCDVEDLVEVMENAKEASKGQADRTNSHLSHCGLVIYVPTMTLSAKKVSITKIYVFTNDNMEKLIVSRQDL